MSLKTLPPEIKADFACAGINLTPTQEHAVAVAPLTPQGWRAVIASLGQHARRLLPLLVAAHVHNEPQLFTPAHASVNGFNHQACALNSFLQALEMACLNAAHYCQCCEGAFESVVGA